MTKFELFAVIEPLGAEASGATSRERVERQSAEARTAARRSAEESGLAIETFEKLESRLELARALVVRGNDEDLGRARELFEGCGAPADLAAL